MITLIISLLMALGLLNSPEQWDTLSPETQREYTEIVSGDLIQG